jgi:hypothetical protein
MEKVVEKYLNQDKPLSVAAKVVFVAKVQGWEIRGGTAQGFTSIKLAPPCKVIEKVLFIAHTFFLLSTFIFIAYGMAGVRRHYEECKSQWRLHRNIWLRNFRFLL